MKFKIFLLVIIVAATIFGAAHYLFIDVSKNAAVTTLKESVSRATSLYKYINKANTLEKIRKGETISQKKELVDAFDEELYKSAPEEVFEKLQVELNIINKFYDQSDLLFITDKNGIVVSQNLEETLKAFSFKNNPLINSALNGKSDEDIFKIGTKIYRVTSVPFYKNREIIGTFSSANVIDSEMAKQDAMILSAETNDDTKKVPFFFAIFDKDTLLGSNTNSTIHDAIKRHLRDNPKIIEEAMKDAERKKALEFFLNGEHFFANVTVHPQMSGEKDVAYMILGSIDSVEQPIESKRNTFILIVAIALLIGLILSFVLEEIFMAPINKFMEGMIEIINGNKKFRFNNEVEGLEGNLNQNANYMISVLLGEKIPENSSMKDEKGDD